jgi:hypothetical protein
MLGVVVVYLGRIAAFLGGLSLLRPLSFLAIRTRRQAARVLALGFMLEHFRKWCISSSDCHPEQGEGSL